jgi:hypothetical protein
MKHEIISISFGDDEITLNNEVTIEVGMIRQVVFDRENSLGKIVYGDVNNTAEVLVNLKSAYTLIVFLGTTSWVNL